MANLPYIYLEPTNPSSPIVWVEGDEAHHLRYVLRLREGDSFIGFNGLGMSWEIRIMGFEREAVKGIALKALPNDPAPRKAVTVAVAAVKGARMDWAVEKAAELGAFSFVPLLTDFGVVKPGKSRVLRWQRISIAAAKQSRSSRLMKVSNPERLRDLYKWCNSMSIFALDFVGEKHSTATLVERFKTWVVTMLVGPEGGFSDDERKQFEVLNIPTVSLGHKPLRTETAVAAGLSLFLYG